jgi:hypothetical protein
MFVPAFSEAISNQFNTHLMHRLILIVVLTGTVCKPFQSSAQQSINLKEVFLSRDRDHESFSDTSTCVIEEKDDFFFSVTSFGRELMVSGRALLHIYPQPTSFIIDLKEHTITIAPNTSTDFFIHSRNWDLISAELLNGSAIWSYNNKKISMAAGTRLHLRDSLYHLDKADFGYREYKAWIKGRYLYDDINLKDFAAEISRKFGIPIRFDDPELKVLRMCTAIDSDEALSTLLDRLSSILHLQYYLDENNAIRLRPKLSDL